jgi:MFS family permease
MKANWPLLGFGFAMTAGSGFGQTFFVGIFNMTITESLNLSATAFGSIFSGATLLSAGLFIWTGKIVDWLSLKASSLIVIGCLSLCCLLLAWSPNIWILALAVLGVRHCGQGLMGHISVTAMGRYFDKNRGKALSISSLGFSSAEGLFPILAVTCLGLYGWRMSWALFSGSLLLILLPIVFLLLRANSRDQRMVAALDSPENVGSEEDCTRADVLKDKRFYLLLPAMVAPAFFLTGMFFHQGSLAEEKTWSLALMAAGFSVFAGSKIISALYFGPMIDRRGVWTLLPIYLAPLALGLATLAFLDHEFVLFFYFMTSGLTTGAAMTLGGAIWPELYGTRHLGAIRSMVVSIYVIATGLAPISFGWLIDRGIEVGTISFGAALYISVAIVPLWLISRRMRGLPTVLGA